MRKRTAVASRFLQEPYSFLALNRQNSSQGSSYLSLPRHWSYTVAVVASSRGHGPLLWISTGCRNAQHLYSSTTICTERSGALDLQLDMAAGDGDWLGYDGAFGEHQDFQRHSHPLLRANPPASASRPGTCLTVNPLI